MAPTIDEQELVPEQLALSTPAEYISRSIHSIHCTGIIPHPGTAFNIKTFFSNSTHGTPYFASRLAEVLEAPSLSSELARSLSSDLVILVVAEFSQKSSKKSLRSKSLSKIVKMCT